MENKIDLHLKKTVENIEKLEEEKKEVSRQISDVYKEAKASGFDTDIIRKLIAIRKIDKGDLQEAEYLLETYKNALGMR